MIYLTFVKKSPKFKFQNQFSISKMASPVKSQVYLLSMYLKSMSQKSLYTEKAMGQKSIIPNGSVSKVNVSKRQWGA